MNYERNSLKIFYNQNSFTCELPISFQNFFDNLHKLLNKQKINFGSLHYSPLSQELLSLNNKIKLSEISMGMTNDYLDAIEYRSTYLRIGSNIFGKRS